MYGVPRYADIEYALFPYTWKVVYMLEKKNAEKGLLSVAELLPGLHSEYPCFYECIKDALFLMLNYIIQLLDIQCRHTIVGK